MELINPAGSGQYNEITPFACVCGNWDMFAIAQGGSRDSCSHCGCHCNNILQRGSNQSWATTTNQRS